MVIWNCSGTDYVFVALVLFSRFFGASVCALLESLPGVRFAAEFFRLTGQDVGTIQRRFAWPVLLMTSTIRAM